MFTVEYSIKYLLLHNNEVLLFCEQVCVQLPTSADKVTLLAFAAESRAAAPLLLGADRAAIDRCLLPAGAEQQTRRPPQRRAAAKLWDGRTDGQTDRRSDGHRTVL